MKYVTQFCLCSALFLAILLIVYFREKKIPSMRSRIYSYMLVAAFLALIGDYLAGEFDAIGSSLPVWLIYLVNILYLAFTQSSPLFFFIYVMVLTGMWNKTKEEIRIAYFIPFILVCCLLILSPFTRVGIFYIDSLHVYNTGLTHLALYVSAGLYIISSLIMVIITRKSIQKRKTFSIYAFILMTVLMMLIQLSFPTYLINTTANALSLFIMYFTLEAPSQYIDPVTKVFSRTALSQLVRDFNEQNEQYNIYVFPLNVFDELSNTLGTKNADTLRFEIAEYIQKVFDGCYVAMYSNKCFAVLDVNQKFTPEKIKEILNNAPSVWNVDDISIEIIPWGTAIMNANKVKIDDLKYAVYYFASELNFNGHERLIVADKDMISTSIQYSKLTYVVARQVSERKVDVFYQPIHDRTGKLVAFEALARMYDEEMGWIPPETFIKIAEESGDIISIGEQVIKKVCRFFVDNDLSNKGIEYVSINLSVLQLMKEDFFDRIQKIFDGFKIQPQYIRLEITESILFSCQSVAEGNIKKLVDAGYKFLLDDFGTGYSNFATLTSLPLSCVKIDKSILWNATTLKQVKLLSCIVDVMHGLDLNIIVEGVETVDQVTLLNQLDVPLHQGFYYSMPITSVDAINYISHENNKDNKE